MKGGGHAIRDYKTKTVPQAAELWAADDDVPQIDNREFRPVIDEDNPIPDMKKKSPP
ncbi:MAG: hypothetical protein LBL45_12130 [Treponema sp.]|jgi:hypothetical protein|nr:hypothetical protein [Treponema sp.]